MLFGGEEEHGMSAKVRAFMFFMLSTALLVIYAIQQGFTTQCGIWIFVIIAGTGVTAFSTPTDFINTAIVALLGISGGMVLGNATIQLK